MPSRLPPSVAVVRLYRAMPHVLGVIALATMLLIVKEWAYVVTYRLYLDHRVNVTSASTARQRFDLEPAGVVPRVVVRDEVMSFRAAIQQDAMILTEVSAVGTGRYEIHIRQDGADTVVAGGPVNGTVSIAAPFPGGNGVVDIVSHGELTWSDLRLRRGLRLAPELWLLGILGVIGLIWKYAVSGRGHVPRWTAPERTAWFGVATLVISAAIGLLVIEVALRASARWLPSGMTVLRRDLGEPAEDPRWQVSPRYGQRLSPNVSGAPNEWRDGDIVRMGFLPPVSTDRLVHRYVFHTDGEGFRNAAVRDPIDVAALGDSFTDGLTVAAEAAWPAQLEQRLGLTVQNYGTAGFGPQQERLVLEDFALPHHPRLVVLAFFAGNDIRDAERFEEFERGDHTYTRPTIGWPIKHIFTRADTWYIASLLRVATASPRPAAPPAEDTLRMPAAVEAPSERARFDRGLFSVTVNGRALRWAFMPPYLNLLQFSERDIAARRGWTLVLDNIRSMQRMSLDHGAPFVLMFIPFKSQVYLPLLERTFSPADLVAALHFSLPDLPDGPNVAEFSRNRLAQNALMQRFCEEARIPFLDLTPVLQERVDGGENMYFVDDSHLNEAGQALAATTLANFLQQRGLIR